MYSSREQTAVGVSLGLPAVITNGWSRNRANGAKPNKPGWCLCAPWCGCSQTGAALLDASRRRWRKRPRSLLATPVLQDLLWFDEAGQKVHDTDVCEQLALFLSLKKATVFPRALQRYTLPRVIAGC